MSTSSEAGGGRRAVLLDRDGVLVADRGLAVGLADFAILPGVPESLRRLADAGWILAVATNQPVVARGLIDEAGLDRLHAGLDRLLQDRGAPPIRHWYRCPHHPEANLPAYRRDCACRKPQPGLLLQAAGDLGLDLRRSVMVGDRASDIAAGRRAGCRTILVECGRHADPAIRTAHPPAADETPHHRCADLAAAADWILAP